jgi:hypothetical protein
MRTSGYSPLVRYADDAAGTGVTQEQYTWVTSLEQVSECRINYYCVHYGWPSGMENAFI